MTRPHHPTKSEGKVDCKHSGCAIAESLTLLRCDWEDTDAWEKLS